MGAAEHLVRGYPEETQTQPATTSRTGQGRRPCRVLLACLFARVGADSAFTAAVCGNASPPQAEQSQGEILHLLR